jgi:hypothetical protein
LSFHTELVDIAEPGIYRVTIETVNSQGNVIHVNTSLVEVRDVAANPINITATSGEGSGVAQFLQNILRAIFGD